MGGGGPGDPNIPPPSIDPQPGGDALKPPIDAEFSEVPKELPAPQKVIEHRPATPADAPLLEHQKKRLEPKN